MRNEVQQAREALGFRLGDIRKDARVSGRQLAALAGWHFTKISKIEHGRSMPSDADIELWCFHCDAESQITDLTAAARGIEKMYVELKRLLRAGTAQYQQELLDEETRTRHFRIFDPAIIPGALQTPGYAAVRLSEFADMVGIPADISATVAVRMERAGLLLSGERLFHVVLGACAARSPGRPGRDGGSAPPPAGNIIVAAAAPRHTAYPRPALHDVLRLLDLR